MSTSSTVVDAVRVTQDVNIPINKCLVLAVPFDLFDNAGCTQVHFGKLDLLNINRIHYAKIIQYCFDIEVIRCAMRDDHKAIDRVYIQRSKDHIVFFLVTENEPTSIIEAANTVLTSNKVYFESKKEHASKKPNRPKDDPALASTFISARETVMQHDYEGAVNTVCFPAAVFNKTFDKLSSYSMCVKSANDIRDMYTMIYTGAGFQEANDAIGGGGVGAGAATSGGGGSAGGAGGGGGEQERRRGTTTAAQRFGGIALMSSDDEDGDHGHPGDYPIGGRGTGDDEDSDADDQPNAQAGAPNAGGGVQYDDSNMRVRFLIPSTPRAAAPSDEVSDDGAPAAEVVIQYENVNMVLEWGELHAFHNPAFKHLGILDLDSLANNIFTIRASGDGVKPLYCVRTPYHLFENFYFSIEPCGNLLRHLEVYARVHVEKDTRDLEQNPPGDMSILKRFRHYDSVVNYLEVDPSVLKFQDFATMVFGRLSTSDALPDTVRKMMNNTNVLYRIGKGVLYKHKKNSETAVDGPVIMKYANLSPVANTMLFLMQLSELQDAASLHVVDLMLSIAMLSTAPRMCKIDINGKITAIDMANHTCLAGSPGIGKSEAIKRVKDRFPTVCADASVTHASKLANTGVQKTDDQFNYAPELYDEAKAHILGSEDSKQSSDDKDKRDHFKERQSEGLSKAKRLQSSEERGAGMITVFITSILFNSPVFFNTNEFVSIAAPNPSIDRSSIIYPFTQPRMWENVSRTLANRATTEKTVSKYIEAMVYAYTVFFFMSKLQELNIMPSPDTSVLDAFMSDFVRVLKDNPFRNNPARSYNPSSREYGLIRVAYINIINFSMAMAFFVDPSSPITDKRFDITQILSLSKYMYVGDVQAAIFALSIKSHEMVNPFVCEVRDRIVRKALPRSGDRQRFSVCIVGGKDRVQWGDDASMDNNSYDPNDTDQQQQQQQQQRDHDTVYRDRRYEILNNLSNIDPVHHELLSSRYVYVFTFTMEATRTGSNHSAFDYADALKKHLGTTNSFRKMAEKDIRQILYDMQVMTPAYGDDQNNKYIEIVKNLDGKYCLFSLETWVLESLQQKFTFKSMVRDALMRNKFSVDQRIVIPEPLQLGASLSEGYTAPPHLLHLFDGTCKDAVGKYVPHAFDFIDIPRHEPVCPAFTNHDTDWKGCNSRWRRTLTDVDTMYEHEEDCICFRTAGKPTMNANKEFKSSIETMAQMVNIDLHRSGADPVTKVYEVAAPRTWGAGGKKMYPDHLLEEAMGASAGTVHTYEPPPPTVQQVEKSAKELEQELVAEMEIDDLAP
jgi:hypothetical protein